MVPADRFHAQTSCHNSLLFTLQVSRGHTNLWSLHPACPGELYQAGLPQVFTQTLSKCVSCALIPDDTYSRSHISHYPISSPTPPLVSCAPCSLVFTHSFLFSLTSSLFLFPRPPSFQGPLAVPLKSLCMISYLLVAISWSLANPLPERHLQDIVPALYLLIYQRRLKFSMAIEGPSKPHLSCFPAWAARGPSMASVAQLCTGPPRHLPSWTCFRPLVLFLHSRPTPAGCSAR